MSTLTIPVELAKRLEAHARREQRTVEALLETWLREHETPTTTASAAVPTEQTDQAAILRQDRLRMYERVRAHWREAGDARATMTDAALDEQFWLIDPDGVPRLKTEMGNINIPSDPFKLMLEASTHNTTVLDPHLDRDDLSENFDELLGDLIRRDQRKREADQHGG